MFARILTAAVMAIPLAACATTPGPVEVTRFVAADSSARLAQGPIFVMGAQDEDSLELAPFKAAVVAELIRLGYRESARSDAGQIAEVSAERFTIDRRGERGPVSVGVGGSTGSYGSGVGVGVGITLGGGGREEVETEMRVVIRDAADGTVLWEGRAEFAVSRNSPLAQRDASAQTVAAALFSEFPGINAETVLVEVTE